MNHKVLDIYCIFFLFICFISSCALKIKTNRVTTNDAPLSENNGTFVIIDVDTFKYDNARFLGVIEIKDGGLNLTAITKLC